MSARHSAWRRVWSRTVFFLPPRGWSPHSGNPIICPTATPQLVRAWCAIRSSSGDRHVTGVADRGARLRQAVERSSRAESRAQAIIQRRDPAETHRCDSPLRTRTALPVGRFRGRSGSELAINGFRRLQDSRKVNSGVSASCVLECWIHYIAVAWLWIRTCGDHPICRCCATSSIASRPRGFRRRAISVLFLRFFSNLSEVIEQTVNLLAIRRSTISSSRRVIVREKGLRLDEE